MRAAKHWRLLWLGARVVAVIVLFGIASVPVWAPTIAAAACPGCYGMEPIADNIFVNAAMSEGRRREVRTLFSAAELPVFAFFGSLSHRRIILVCGDEDCEKRLKGCLEGSGRIRAFAYDAAGYPVLRFSPRGLNATIVVHELTHVEVHERIGFLNHMRGVFPAWFDEGLAVVISEDLTYLKPGGTAVEKCKSTPAGDLPTNPISWDAKIGKSPWIYAKAACRVMHWMEANGGRDGVLAAIADVAAGKHFLP